MTAVEQTASPLMVEAQKVITRTIVRHGRGTVSCDCGGFEVYLDSANASTADDPIEQVARLVEHARYDHVTPRAIIVTLEPIVVVDYAAEARQGAAS